MEGSKTMKFEMISWHIEAYWEPLINARAGHCPAPPPSAFAILYSLSETIIFIDPARLESTVSL